jgi:hypothetical protein
MNNTNLKYGLIALAGLGFSANVSAADLTCSDITFTPEAFAAYEFIDKACLEMVDRDGSTYAKMTAKIVAQTNSGTRLRIRHSDGTEGPTHKSNMAKNFLTRIGGKETKLKDLGVRQEMNVYVGDEYWSRPTVAAPVAAVVAAAPPPPPPPAPEPEPEPEPEMLPTTASSLPLLALFGSLFLILGGALRLSRKQ